MSLTAMTGASPALFTTASIRPKRRSVSATSASTSAGSVTSAGNATPPTSRAASSRSLRVREVSTTSYPPRFSSAATAFPIPRAAPVMMARGLVMVREARSQKPEDRSQKKENCLCSTGFWLLAPGFFLLRLLRPDDRPHGMCRLAGEGDGVVLHVARLDADEALPFILAKIRERLGWAAPRVPDDRRVGAFLIDADAPSAHWVIDHALGACTEIDAVARPSQHERVFAVDELLHVAVLVEVRRGGQAADARLPDVADGEVRVQRLLEHDRVGQRVRHLERQVQLGSDRHDVPQPEVVRPQRVRLVARAEGKRRGDRIAAGGDRIDVPVADAREPVHRRLRVAGARAEPREDDRHPAADRAAVREEALFAEEQDGLLPARLVVRDVRAVEVDVRLGRGRREDEFRKSAVTRLEPGGAFGVGGEATIELVDFRGVAHGRIVPDRSADG